jgi:hypothetical protein
MKKSIFLFGILCVASFGLRAQSPRIDSLGIDDPSGRLTIFGSFGLTSGTITVDSVTSSFTLWSTDSIVCTLQDTGRGSCGPVVVSNHFGSSNQRLLSAYYLQFLIEYQSHGPVYINSSVEGHFQFRLDLLRAIASGVPEDMMTTPSSALISYGRDTGGVHVDSTRHGPLSINFNPKTRLVITGPYDIYGLYYPPLSMVTFQLDGSFQLPVGGLPGTAYWGQVPGGVGLQGAIGEKPAAFIPPDSELYASVLTTPNENATGLEVWSDVGILHSRFPIASSFRALRILDAIGRHLTDIEISPMQPDISIPCQLSSGFYFAILNNELRKFVVMR